MSRQEDGREDGGPVADAPLTINDFAEAVGEAFQVETAGGVALTLVAADPLPQSPRDGGGFRLEFEGPAQPPLDQAIHRLARDDKAHDIFIVPIGTAASGAMRYEAVFF